MEKYLISSQETTSEYRRILKEEGFSDGTTHNHPSGNKNPSMVDFISGTSDKPYTVEVVVTKDRGAFTWVADDVAMGRYSWFGEQLIKDPDFAAAFLRYRATVLREFGQVEVAESYEGMAKSYLRVPQDEITKKHMRNLALEEYKLNIAEDWATNFLGTKEMKDYGELTSSFYSRIDEGHLSYKYEIIPSKARLKQNTVDSFDESEFIGQ